MTVLRLNLGKRPDHRFKEVRHGGEDRIYYWVHGPLGATSMWISDTRPTIGRCCVAGIVYHSLVPWRDSEVHGKCDFLGGQECWADIASAIHPVHERIREAFEKEDDEFIFRTLEAHYQELVK